MLADRRIFFSLIINQIHAIQKFEVVDFATYFKNQPEINVIANDGKVDVGAGTVIALRPRPK